MALKKEDFTEEQWAEIEAETDRRATQASETARKNAEAKAQKDLNEKIQAAIAEERAKLEMDEQQKLEAERKKVEEAQAALAQERRSLVATKKLAAAGFDDEAINSLVPTFTNLGDDVFETAVDSFIAVNDTIVKSKVDAVKQELLNGATPPPNPTGGPTDAQTAALEQIKAGNDAAAVEMMLTGAGYTPTQ